eukprot:TRINITY_DN30483_c2_g1_i2.p1 TRINITY_DN30483_c2_g1~~TRINITY_DN30483_c2_g1_i2.p1  ORF type:complete len:798 (-),score=161.54 TRINITY_DN30483_c2_g1_i2:2-2395(-)
MEPLRQLGATLSRLRGALSPEAGERAAAVALEYLRSYIPAKFLLLRRLRTEVAPSLAALFSAERALLDALAAAAARAAAAPAEAGPAPHSYCGHSWLAAITATCVGHLSATLEGGHADFHDALIVEPDLFGCGMRLTETPAGLADDVQGAWLQRGSLYNWTTADAQQHGFAIEATLEGVRDTPCVAQEVLRSLSCGLSVLARAGGGEEGPAALPAGYGSDAGAAVAPARLEASTAAAFLEDAALRLLLCHGCRYDGRGLAGVSLDEVTWLLGFLRDAARHWRRGGAELRAAYARALAEFRSHPTGWWRGDGDQLHLYGRTADCASAWRDLCVFQGKIETLNPEVPVALPSCQLDREPSDFSSVSRLPKEASASCSWAPAGVVGLFLPINVGALNSLNHLTGIITWLLPALAWLHGGEQRERLIAALWRRGGLAGIPPRALEAASTEVILVMHHGDVRQPGKVTTTAQSIVRELLPMLSLRAVWSVEDEEFRSRRRCFASAIWGYPDPSLRMRGDLDFAFAGRLRGVLRTHLDHLALASPSSAAAAAARSEDGSAWRAVLHRAMRLRGFRLTPSPPRGSRREEGHSRRLGVLLAYRMTTLKHVLERNFTNVQALTSRLVQHVDGTPPLQLMVGAMEKLTLATQLRLAMDFVDIMVQPFGAGMTFSLVMRRGSYVIELQEDGVSTSNFVGCFSAWAPRRGSRSPDAEHVAATETQDLWEPSANPNSEWGAWARANRVHFACVSRRPTPARCYRAYMPSAWDTPFLTVDVDSVVALVLDAAKRLAGSHARERVGERERER